MKAVLISAWVLRSIYVSVCPRPRRPPGPPATPEPPAVDVTLEELRIIGHVENVPHVRFDAEGGFRRA